MSKNSNRKQRAALCFLLPHLILFCLFSLLPSLAGIYAAFTKWSLGKAPEWVGLANLRAILTDQNSIYYWKFRWGLQNTCLFVLLAVPLRIIVPLLLAAALNTRCKGHTIFQTLFYLPGLLSLSIVMISWNYMFDTNYGIVNNLLNLGKLSWVNRVPYNWIAIIIITVWWGTSASMIIFQSALAGVPTEQLEAAQLDGAGAVKRFFYIKLPAIRYPLTYVAATSIIQEFNVWGQPYMFNNGGPVIENVNGYAHQSNIMLMQIIKDTGFNGTTSSNAGVAAAMSLILGIIMVIVSIVQVRLMQKEG